MSRNKTCHCGQPATGGYDLCAEHQDIADSETARQSDYEKAHMPFSVRWFIPKGVTAPVLQQHLEGFWENVPTVDEGD